MEVQNKVEEENQTEPWFEGIKSLAVENGPLDQLREALEQLAKKLKPRTGVKGVTRAWIWTLDKNYCDEILKKVERLKSRINLALQGQV